MSDTGDKGPAPVTPSWQRDVAAQSAAAAEQDQQDQQDQHDQHDQHDQQSNQSPQPTQQLEVARQFLQQPHVKASSREKKTEFLKSKGLDNSNTEKLLGQAEQDHSITTTNAASQEPQSTNDLTDRPPIVTYPEFLVQPARPPPLVTKNGLLSALYAFAGLSTILYGTSRYLVAPMVDILTDARTELHHVAAEKLDGLVARLEKTVSVVPPAATARPGPAESDGEVGGGDEDPTEVFHRDVGTQTSLIDKTDGASSPAARSVEIGTASRRQADQLMSLTKTLSLLKVQLRAEGEELEHVKTLLDVFRDDLDGMTYGGTTDFWGGYDVYGSSKKNEPEDEIRKARDNIRRVKGLFLSTRNFPASTR
ncbi:hypothetical protein E4U41_003145 [Claviceps citrina]|nr:hypothetical protein E4U41_003145 [Claviceps citrina]